MGAGRWSRWGVPPNEGYALEFGFSYRFDIRPGSRKGVYPETWFAHARNQCLGEFPTFEAAAEACEAEARQLIEAAGENAESNRDMMLVLDHWKMYLERPHRLRPLKQSRRRR